MNKRLLQLILILLMPIVCSAEKYVSLEVDGIKFFIEDTEYKFAQVSGFTSKTVTIPEKIQYKGDDYVVYDHRYGIKNLSGFDNLESLISKIRIKADFSYHPNIKTVKIPFPLEFSFEHCDNLESVTFTSNENANNVKLYQNSFSFCPKLKNVIFPSNMKVTEIEGAFRGCTSLKNLSIPLQIIRIGDGAFSGCTSLTSINIHWDSVRYIGEDAFFGCKSLKLFSLDIPNGVTYIGKSAFEGCTRLSSVNIPNSVTQIRQRTFYGTGLTEITIPNSVTSIGEDAFLGCSGLTSVNIFDIAAWCKIAFSGDQSNPLFYARHLYLNGEEIKDLVIPNSVTSIGNNAFRGYSGLTSVIIPNSVKKIGPFAFCRCTSLASVTIGGDDITINGGAFAKCTRLTDVIFEEGNKIIPVDPVISGITNDYNATTGEYETFTAYSIFDGCTNLQSLTVRGTINLNNSSFSPNNQGMFIRASIPNIFISDVNAWLNSNIGFSGGGDTWVERYRLFLNGEELEHLKIPEGVTTINDAAFGGCTSLKSVTIPNSVTSIGQHAFTNCDSLLLVMSEIEKPFTFDVGPRWNGIFCYYSDTDYGNWLLEYNCYVYKKDLLTLYVPIGTVSDYKNTKDWDRFPNISVWNPDSPPQDLDELYPAPFHNRPRVTVTANSYTISYGDELPKFEYTSSGATLYGIPEITCEATKTSPVGAYPIVISKGTVTNTKTTFVNGTLTITKAPLTIKADSYTKVEGEENPTFTLTYEGFKNNETSDVLTKQPTVSCSATKDSPAGDYPVTVSGAEAQNYEISYVAGTLTITANSPELNDGDVFTATNAEGVELTFQVISAADKTCRVARQGKDRITIVTYPVPESITIPAEVKGFKVISIGYQAFYGAKGIKSVVIPEGVTSIDTHAFRECYNLASFTFPKSLKECGLDSFEDCAFGATVHISDLKSWCNVSLVSWGLYGWHLFLNGEEVNDLVIPDGVTSIGESSERVSPLTNCASLTSVTIPASVTKMYAPFSGCSNLSSVTTFAEEPVAIYTGFPNATNSITNATLYVPKGSKAAYEAADYWKDFKEILEIEDETPEDIITFADPNVKVICVANWDTSGDGKLSKTEAAVVTSLGDVFMGNSEITSFDELQYFTGLTTIPDNAFYGCGSLKSIRLPKSLTSIGEYAFEDCTSLETVVSFIETPFELGEGAFCARESYDGGNDWLEFDLHFNLYVPIGTKGLYRAAGWDVDESYGNYRTILSGTPENPGSFTVDGIVYDPIDATTVELIDGKNASGDVTIPSMVANGNANYQVTEIGACAFKGNTSLTSIVIPNCVKAIRPFAFNGCTGLTTVTSYIETPFSLSALKGVFLNNENVVYATYLQFTLYVPAGTKSLYEQASWTDASRIVEIEDETPEPLPVGSTFTEDNGVIYKVIEGNTVTVINGKNAIGDVVIPDKVVNNGVEYTVTAIAEGAFYKGGETQNAELTSITIPSSVERIEPMTFQYCSSLTSIVIPEGVTSIGWQAFLGCTSLSSVSIPSTVTTVEVNAFSNCTALNDVYITDIAAYCAIPFKYYTSSPLYYAKHLYLNGEEVKELVIPQGVTAIDNYAFYNCRSLNSVTLPSSLTSIGDYVFYKCENITQLISYIKTPENISSAYYYMTERNADLIIPVGSKSKYETATGWKNFQNVVEISAFDINHDYYIDKTDVKNLVNDIMGKRPANYDKTQDDITGDQKVDMLDIVKMVRIIKNRYPNTEAYLGYDPEAAGGDIDIDDPPCVDCGED